MNKIIVKSVLVLLVGVMVSFGMYSCRKELPTVAKIRVVDTSGAAFPNAMVRLYPTPTVGVHGAIVLDDTMYTDVTGYATFDYTDFYNLGQAGVAVLDIEVRSGDSLYGKGIIKIEQEKTSQETVILQH